MFHRLPGDQLLAAIITGRIDSEDLAAATYLFYFRLLTAIKTRTIACLHQAAPDINASDFFAHQISYRKMQIRFALLGDEWLYIKLQASPFSSCMNQVSDCACDSYQ